MYDRELIQKVCALKCSKEEVVRNQTTIKYDTAHPFKTYYNVSTITGAINKYISNEWDDQTHQGRVAPLYLITRQRASFPRLDAIHGVAVIPFRPLV